MACLMNILLEGSRKFNGRNYNTWKQRMLTIFEYRVIDQLVLGKATHPSLASPIQTKFDEQNRETVMLIKLSMIDDQLP